MPKEIALLYPKTHLKKPDAVAPLAPLQLGAILKEDGFEVTFMDANVTNISSERLSNFTAFAVSSTTPQYPEALKMLNLINEVHGHSPNIQAHLGGVHATIMQAELIKDGWTTVTAGDGDLIIAGLFNNQYRGFISAPMVKNLDGLPFPDRSLINMKTYKKAHETEPSASIVSIRGCPFSCSFCLKDFYLNKVRVRSPNNVVSEMKQIIDRYSIRLFHFYDPTFSLLRKRAIQLTQGVRDLSVKWTCETRFDQVDKELFKYFSDSGCTQAALAVESANKRVQASIFKPIDLQDAAEKIKFAQACNIKIKVYLMFGFPEDDWDSVKDNLEFLKNANPDVVQLSLTVPFPKTRLMTEVTKLGISIPNDPGQFYFAGLEGPHTFINRTKYLDEITFPQAVQALQEGIAEWATSQNGQLKITNVEMA